MVYDEINLLVNDILDGSVSRDDVASRIKSLKELYGDDIFPDINFQKEPKPWNSAYFSKLKKMNITGACSEEFILHMAEVGEYIRMRKRKLIIGIAIIVILLFFTILIFILKPASQMSISAAAVYEIFYIEETAALLTDFALIA